MILRSLGLQSDLMVMRGISTVTEDGDRVILRTEAEPDFWFGNMVIMRNAPVDAVADTQHFARDFPNASHSIVVWDVPGLNPAPIAPILEPLGYDMDRYDVLILTDRISRREVPAGISIRMHESDADWTETLSLQSEVAGEEGYDLVTHLPYLQRRNTSRRLQICEGLGAWFGAWDGETLVAQLGIFNDAKIIRYQSVETRASHRKRGICAALLVNAYAWARSRAPLAQTVIVADQHSDAGRLYRRMGFALHEEMLGAVKAGY